MMSMQEQIRRMGKVFPNFELRFNGGWIAVWQGELRPFARTYCVQVRYSWSHAIGDMEYKAPWFPEVSLVAPQLITVHPKNSEAVPHIYLNSRSPAASNLCMFDPATEEWSRDMSIADTTLPWTIDWLASYEGWLATGEWTGGGRDHGVAAK